tara:strand:+ start:221 stop:1225 length:1005 start_codon:yes stop_codon:yes gene_type:complete
MSKNVNKCLVIGSNSFSGSSIIDFLLKKKFKIVGVSRSKEIQKEFLNYKSNKYKKNFRFHKIDINKKNDRKKLLFLIKKFKPKILINYSAQGMVAQSWERPEDWYKTNLVSQSILYKELTNFRFIKKIIHVTTPEVYGSSAYKIKENFEFKPSTPYAISRAAMDFHLINLYKNFKLPIILTRTANIYGPGQQLYRIIPKAFMCSKKNIRFNLHGGGKSIRSFIYMEDVSRATYLIFLRGKIGETYHISNNYFLTIKKLVQKISKIQNVNFNSLCKIDTDRVGKDHAYKLNFDKLKRLKWKPKFNLETGLFHTKKWIDQNYKNLKNKELNYKHKR